MAPCIGISFLSKTLKSNIWHAEVARRSTCRRSLRRRADHRRDGCAASQGRLSALGRAPALRCAHRAVKRNVLEQLGSDFSLLGLTNDMFASSASRRCRLSKTTSENIAPPLACLKNPGQRRAVPWNLPHLASSGLAAYPKA